MALEVEDGSGKSNSESYISVTDADSYFSVRGKTAWAALDTTTKEQALRLATDYMDVRCTYFGSMYQSTQAHEWPRYPFDVTAIPTRVKNACCEYALRAASAPLAPDPVTDDRGLSVVEIENEVGGAIKERIRYQEGVLSPLTFRSYPEADAFLFPYILRRQLERA